jgi:hypothetical protein
MTPVSWPFSSYMLVYWLAYLVVIGGVIVALYRANFTAVSCATL